jgi:hypothetical protein
MNDASRIRRIARSIEKKVAGVSMQYIGRLDQDGGLSAAPTVSVSI